MTVAMEWCRICLDDSAKVAATQIVDGVPLCTGCLHTFGDDKSVVASYKSVISDDQKKSHRRDGNKEHLCDCGCGKPTRNGWDYLKGHETSVQAKEEQNPYPPEAEEEQDDSIHVDLRVDLTEEDAEELWSGLTLEQKAIVMDVDGMWKDFDGNLKCTILSRVVKRPTNDIAKILEFFWFLAGVKA